MRTLLLCVLLLGQGCRDEQVELNLIEHPVHLDEILLSADSIECKGRQDCASDVCADGFCKALPDASQTWMERRIAARIGAILRRHPGSAARLHRQDIPAASLNDPFVRARFAGMLGYLGDPQFIPALQRWAQSDIERVRVRAILALGRLGLDENYPQVHALLTHSSEGVALDAADALLGYADTPHRSEIIRTLVERTRPPHTYRHRQRAVRLLGQLGRPASSEAVAALEAVRDAKGQEYLRFDAERALSLLKN